MIVYSNERLSSLTNIKLIRTIISAADDRVLSHYSYRFDGDKYGKAMTKAAAIERHNWNRFYARSAKDCI